MSAAVRSSGGVDNYRPVVNGRGLPCQPFDAAAVRLSAGVPLMTGWCENEQRLNFASMPHIYCLSEAQAVANTASVVGVSAERASALMAVYRNGRPHDSPGDIYAQICGDHRYRRTVTRAAELQLLHGGGPVYMYMLRWKTPVQGGLLRTPHTLCIAFAFGNVDIATGITGTGPDRYHLQQEMSSAWLAFARCGNPNHDELPAWPRYSAQQRQTMVFDRATGVVNDPLREEGLALETCPRYIAAMAPAHLRFGTA
jgi:para-nitrobenzyl esterase